MKLLLTIIGLLGISCVEKPRQSSLFKDQQQEFSILNKAGTTLLQRFTTPTGYIRESVGDESITAFFRKLPLKPDGSPVHYYDGREKANPNIYAAVVDMEIGTRDLQQCADAVMRLRAEHLYSAGRQDEIHFNFTNGFRAEWARWRLGNRIVVRGNAVSWAKTAAPASDRKTFRAYLDMVYNYAGTLSLSRELRTVPGGDLQVGDVFIQGGSPGHAVTVLDVAVNASGKKVFLLSQSYMPAQDIQILHNPSNSAISPWYEWNPEAAALPTPQWDFRPGDLRRF